MQDAARPVSLDSVAAARPSFEATRDEYYLDRYEELAEFELAFVAARLSAAFVGTNRRTRREVNELIPLALEQHGRASDRHAVKKVFEQLLDLGYVWAVTYRSRHYLQAGIPSLMAFVAQTEGIDAGIEIV